MITISELSSSLYLNGMGDFLVLGSGRSSGASMRTLYSPGGTPSPDPPVTSENVPSVAIFALGVTGKSVCRNERDHARSLAACRRPAHLAFYLVYLELRQRVRVTASGEPRRPPATPCSASPDGSPSRTR